VFQALLGDPERAVQSQAEECWGKGIALLYTFSLPYLVGDPRVVVPHVSRVLRVEQAGVRHQRCECCVMEQRGKELGPHHVVVRPDAVQGHDGGIPSQVGGGPEEVSGCIRPRARGQRELIRRAGPADRGTKLLR
jgi:hypothetical protein